MKKNLFYIALSLLLCAHLHAADSDSSYSYSTPGSGDTHVHAVYPLIPATLIGLLGSRTAPYVFDVFYHALVARKRSQHERREQELLLERIKLAIITAAGLGGVGAGLYSDRLYNQNENKSPYTFQTVLTVVPLIMALGPLLDSWERYKELQRKNTVAAA